MNLEISPPGAMFQRQSRGSAWSSVLCSQLQRWARRAPGQRWFGERAAPAREGLGVRHQTQGRETSQFPSIELVGENMSSTTPSPPPQHQRPWGLRGPSWGPDKAPSTTLFLKHTRGAPVSLSMSWGTRDRPQAAEGALCRVYLLSLAPAAMWLLPWALATGTHLSCRSGLICAPNSQGRSQGREHYGRWGN